MQRIIANQTYVNTRKFDRKTKCRQYTREHEVNYINESMCSVSETQDMATVNVIY